MFCVRGGDQGFKTRLGRRRVCCIYFPRSYRMLPMWTVELKLCCILTSTTDPSPGSFP